MLNTIYRLVRPRQFEAVFEDVDISGGDMIIRPACLSICNADQRYYQGKRSADVLRQKLPMALIHEAIGHVVYDPSGKLETGRRVVMIPDIPSEKSPVRAENYLETSLFRGSTADGFMQEYIVTPPDRVLPLPEKLKNDAVASFTEMVSVCFHAIGRFDRRAHEERREIGVWGDGNMGYFTALLLKELYPSSGVYVFGVDEDKLSDFSFADAAFHVSSVPADLKVDHAFEAVGSVAAGQVISQIIEHIRPEGTIALLGVSEDPVPVYTRMVLEKGLSLFGTSRSGRVDFEGLLKLYERSERTIGYLEKMVSSVIDVRGIDDMVRAFETDIRKSMGKTVMRWEHV